MRILKQILVGAVTVFVLGSLVLGPSQVIMMLGLAVVCTAGLGLVPIVFLSWLAGWAVLAAWAAFAASRAQPRPS
jgi:hypothetical protein